MLIDKLIDKRDNFDLIRDQIAQILADESASQQLLATAAAEDPALWALKVYIERSAPWDHGAPGDLIVNVWFDKAGVDRKASDPVQRQKNDGTFNIDVIGFGNSAADGAGHLSGDEVAAREASRGVTLVRNIIMADIYTYLSMRGIVWGRMPSSLEFFQPQLNNRAATRAMGARLALDVSYNEFSPQQTPATLEYVATTIKRAEDGSVLAQVDFDYTA